jgi:hypothetical protein
MHRMANNDSSTRSRASRTINTACADDSIRIACKDHYRQAKHEEIDHIFHLNHQCVKWKRTSGFACDTTLIWINGQKEEG